MSEATHLSIIGILVTLICGAYGWGWMLHQSMCKRYEADAAAAKKIADEALAACHTRITHEMQRLEQNFYEYKLHVANTFATLMHLRESEERTQRALTTINAKLDRLIEVKHG